MISKTLGSCSMRTALGTYDRSFELAEVAGSLWIFGHAMLGMYNRSVELHCSYLSIVIVISYSPAG